MSIMVRNGNILVVSNNPEASAAFALAVAKVLNENWLEGEDENAVLTIEQQNKDGTSIKYTIKQVSVQKLQ